MLRVCECYVKLPYDDIASWLQVLKGFAMDLLNIVRVENRSVRAVMRV